MNAVFRTGLAALALATFAVPCSVSAQTTGPAPVAPRLIAPHSVAFQPGDGAGRGIDRAAWAGASGSWQSSTEDGVLSTRATFSGLVPGGHYSLFSRHISNNSTVVAPLDRSGTTNSFIASPDGSAIVTVTVSQALVGGDNVLLIYHADNADHPKTIGRLGADAFIQLRLVQP